MTRARPLLALFVLALALGALAPREARADDAPTLTSPAQLPARQANFAWDKSLLRASFSYKDLITPVLAQKLSNGLRNVITMRAYVFEAGATSPTALAVKTCSISYDVWDEVYRVTRTSLEPASGPTGVISTAVVNTEGVLRSCAEAQDLPIAERDKLKPGTAYFLAGIVELNPVSEEMLAQLQKWVERPMGSTALAPGNALFGAFVGLFVKNIGTSDRTLLFRTQSFTP